MKYKKKKKGLVSFKLKDDVELEEREIQIPEPKKKKVVTPKIIKNRRKKDKKLF